MRMGIDVVGCDCGCGVSVGGGVEGFCGGVLLCDVLWVERDAGAGEGLLLGVCGGVDGVGVRGVMRVGCVVCGEVNVIEGV